VTASIALASWTSRLCALVALLERFPAAILHFIFRFCIAAASWNSGLTKIASRQTIVVLFRDKYKVRFLFVAIA
jgi:hypothetical protein